MSWRRDVLWLVVGLIVLYGATFAWLLIGH